MGTPPGSGKSSVDDMFSKPREIQNDAPWRQWFIDRMGWTEFDHDKELSKGWALTHDCKDYSTVIGLEHAWCGMSLATALNANGYTYPVECESADSYIDYGTPVAKETLNAIVVIQHSSGGHHVAIYDGNNKTLGGNQNDSICIKAIADSDKIVAWRWPVLKDPVALKVPSGGPVVPLSWEKNHPERAYWSKALYGLVLEKFQQLDQAKDMGDFFPGYKSLPLEQRATVWCELFSATAYFECSWDPTAGGPDVGSQTDVNEFSIGLLQLSQVDQKNYGIQLGYSADDLKDPVKNLKLGVPIMAQQIEKRGVIVVDHSPYWATLYHGKYDETKQIAAMVGRLPFAKAA